MAAGTVLGIMAVGTIPGVTVVGMADTTVDIMVDTTDIMEDTEAGMAVIIAITNTTGILLHITVAVAQENEVHTALAHHRQGKFIALLLSVPLPIRIGALPVQLSAVRRRATATGNPALQMLLLRGHG